MIFEYSKFLNRFKKQKTAESGPRNGQETAVHPV
ncbi:hypothetical protein LSS_03529 [Leptospira santarosai serovar Shermani str. LT 821]|uniref:Uncharacterized protein n=1 Tax=Leptospira santarosai serovar Shermani str. LT 821 TaxID=758847 RepID=K8Y3P9_9LEPT|nr:hypothetical protein LSS_03529 [Leptospira santarosai serovar Shermani str. LT 821]